MRAGSAEALEVGRDDRVAGLDPVLELRVDVGDVGRGELDGRTRVGAQESAAPVVPCAQLITGQPPFGALPLGTLTEPETTTWSPCGLLDV